MTTHATFGDPPKADRKNHEHSHHGIVTADPYAWLQDPGYPTVTDPEVLDYLQAQSAVAAKAAGGILHTKRAVDLSAVGSPINSVYFCL